MATKITFTFKFTEVLYILASKWKQQKCPSTGEEINKLWYQHKVKQDTAKSENKLLVHAIYTNKSHKYTERKIQPQ